MRKKFVIITLMLLTTLISATASAFSIATLMDGIYSIQPQCAPGKELSVQNHATNWGANVIIDDLSPNWRKWKVQRIGNTDFYSIIAVHSNLALDVANAQASDGVNIATWPFLNERPNAFRIMDAGNGYYVIQCAIDGSHPFVVDVSNGENRAGANVHSYSFNNSPAQLWKFVMIQRLPTFQSYNKKATKTVPAYVMPDLNSRNGNERVDAGDNVTVLREEGNAYLVIYPVSGGTKTRWVNKNEIFSNSGGGSSTSNIPANLQNLINTYNNKTWRDHTYLPNVKECKEFASFIFNKLYGVGYIGGGSTSDNPKNYLINLTNPNRVALRGYKINLTAQSAQELFQTAQPGDFVQIKRRSGSPHSGIFVSLTNNGIVLFEANEDGKNSIRTNSYSYTDLANRNFAMSVYYAK